MISRQFITFWILYLHDDVFSQFQYGKVAAGTLAYLRGNIKLKVTELRFPIFFLW